MAECYIGRYMTMIGFSAVYAGGCALTAVASSPQLESIPLFLVGILVLTAPGTGGVKPNIGTFGADQFHGSEATRKKEAFFMYLYVCMSMGAVVAFGFLANVATGGLPPRIPKEDGFFFAYIIMAILMGIALCIFIAGTPCYRKESFAKNTKWILMPAVQRLLGGLGTTLGKLALLGWLLLPTLIVLLLVSLVRLRTLVFLLPKTLRVGTEHPSALL